MAFTEAERAALLEARGVGPTVIRRLEQVGVDSFAKLAVQDAETLADLVAKMLRTTCWKNSPQALTALESAISRAKSQP